MPTLDWIGKDKVVNHHQAVPYRVLERKYSFDESGMHDEDNGSGNMIIHGDNLEALKSLLPRYEGKVKCIYIDPPYNTGNEGWVYNDNVNDPKIKKWLGEVVGKEGDDLSRHDKWLCMMYPRLVLLRKLLADNGAIFISLDDNEIFSLKYVCDEIFGSRNFLGQYIWRKKSGGGQAVDYFVTEHEYVLAYAKSYSSLDWEEDITIRSQNDYNHTDERGNYKTTKLAKWGNTARRADRPTMYFPIIAPDGSECYPVAPDGSEGRWRVAKKKWDALIAADLVYWRKLDNRWEPYEKEYYAQQTKVLKQRSILYNIAETGDGTKCLTQIFGVKDQFENPKPVELIKEVIKHVCHDGDIVLDSFAGSGTTAHATMQLDKEDGGHRNFILVEICDYADRITTERVKRVIAGYGAGNKAVAGTGGNFSFYELGERLLDEEGQLNAAVGIDNIRSYIWYMETREDLPAQGNGNASFLGNHGGCAFYFYYNEEGITTLNYEFLATIPEMSESFVIYADRCALSAAELQRFHITFKKIPRDITKL